ncbi:UNVERIFIED_CONTAM: hypothetical protein Sradi_7087300, partial [Sesamum radiatum]
MRERSGGDGGVAGGGADNGDWGGWRRGLKWVSIVERKFSLMVLVELGMVISKSDQF